MSAYDYISLQQAFEVASDPTNPAGGTRNLFAVVTDCTVPRPTAGTDYVSNLVLSDASADPLGDSQQGVPLLCFAHQASLLPKLQQVGDIIRLHRIRLQLYNGKLQLVAKVHKPASFLLLDGRSEAPETPYQRSSETFTWDGRDSAMLQLLRRSNRHGLHEAPPSPYQRRTQDIRVGEFFDLTCKVVAVCTEVGPNGQDTIMYVWDGTDQHPFPLALADVRDEDIHLTPDELPLEQWRPEGIDAQIPLQEIQQELPELGTLLPVVLYKISTTGSRQFTLPAAGSWAKLRNVGATLLQGQLMGLYHHQAKWMPSAPVASILQGHQQRRASNHVSVWAPDSRHELQALADVPGHFTPLRTVLRDCFRPGARQPQTYQCLVRLLSWEPRRVEHAAQPRAACGLAPADEDQSPWVWMLRLKLADATGQLDALLFSEDGTHFLQGQLAQDLRQQPGLCERLSGSLNRLKSFGTLRAGGEWLECRLRSFFVVSDSDPSQADAYFRLTQTQLNPALHPWLFQLQS